MCNLLTNLTLSMGFRVCRRKLQEKASSGGCEGCGCSGSSPSRNATSRVPEGSTWGVDKNLPLRKAWPTDPRWGHLPTLTLNVGGDCHPICSPGPGTLICTSRRLPPVAWWACGARTGKRAVPAQVRHSMVLAQVCRAGIRGGQGTRGSSLTAVEKETRPAQSHRCPISQRVRQTIYLHEALVSSVSLSLPPLWNGG